MNTLSYKTAKELKDAGFPQRIGNYVCPPSEEYPEHGVVVKDGKVYCSLGEELVSLPTLSELIEECGEEFHSLNQHGTWSATGDKLWRAEPKGQDYKDMKTGTGSTPEEAVARLWLALNKKP